MTEQARYIGNLRVDSSLLISARNWPADV